MNTPRIASAAGLSLSMSLPTLRAGYADELEPAETKVSVEAPEAPPVVVILPDSPEYRHLQRTQQDRKERDAAESNKARGLHPSGASYLSLGLLRREIRQESNRRDRYAAKPDPDALRAAAERRERRAQRKGASHYAEGNAL